MIEEKEEGISLGEILHVIFIKKWLLIAVTLIITLIGTIFAQFIYNPSSENYRTDYKLKFPGYESGLYPDGNAINYTEFIDLESLTEIKNSSEDFSNIDVETMVDANDISIERLTTTVNGEEVRTNAFTIVVAKKYFNSNSVAKKFLEALVSAPVDYAIESNSRINYKYDLTQSKLADTYENEVNYLIAQRDMIRNGYNGLIANYSNAYSISLENNEVMTLNQAKSEFEAFFASYNLETLLMEIEQNGYIKMTSDYEARLRNEIASLKRERDLNSIIISATQTKLDALLEQLSGLYDQAQIEISLNVLQGYYEIIRTKQERNVEITYLINVVYNSYLKDPNIDPQYGDYINDPNFPNIGDYTDYDTMLNEFKTKLDEFYKKLEEFTNIYEQFLKESFENESYVIYSVSSKVVSEGGISIVVALGASLILGFCVACCLNLVLDMPKYLKEKKEKELQDNN